MYEDGYYHYTDLSDLSVSGLGRVRRKGEVLPPQEPQHRPPPPPPQLSADRYRDSFLPHTTSTATTTATVFWRDEAEQSPTSARSASRRQRFQTQEASRPRPTPAHDSPPLSPIPVRAASQKRKNIHNVLYVAPAAAQLVTAEDPSEVSAGSIPWGALLQSPSLPHTAAAGQDGDEAGVVAASRHPPPPRDVSAMAETSPADAPAYYHSPFQEKMRAYNKQYTPKKMVQHICLSDTHGATMVAKSAERHQTASASRGRGEGREGDEGAAEDIAAYGASFFRNDRHSHHKSQSAWTAEAHPYHHAYSHHDDARSYTDKENAFSGHGDPRNDSPPRHPSRRVRHASHDASRTVLYYAQCVQPYCHITGAHKANSNDSNNNNNIPAAVATVEAYVDPTLSRGLLFNSCLDEQEDASPGTAAAAAAASPPPPPSLTNAINGHVSQSPTTENQKVAPHEAPLDMDEVQPPFAAASPPPHPSPPPPPLADTGEGNYSFLNNVHLFRKKEEPAPPPQKEQVGARTESAAQKAPPASLRGRSGPPRRRLVPPPSPSPHTKGLKWVLQQVEGIVHYGNKVADKYTHTEHYHLWQDPRHAPSLVGWVSDFFRAQFGTLGWKEKRREFVQLITYYYNLLLDVHHNNNSNRNKARTGNGEHVPPLLLIFGSFLRSAQQHPRSRSSTVSYSVTDNTTTTTNNNNNANSRTHNIMDALNGEDHDGPAGAPSAHAFEFFYYFCFLRAFFVPHAQSKEVVATLHEMEEGEEEASDADQRGAKKLQKASQGAAGQRMKAAATTLLPRKYIAMEKVHTILHTALSAIQVYRRRHPAADVPLSPRGRQPQPQRQPQPLRPPSYSHSYYYYATQKTALTREEVAYVKALVMGWIDTVEEKLKRSRAARRNNNNNNNNSKSALDLQTRLAFDYVEASERGTDSDTMAITTSYIDMYALMQVVVEGIHVLLHLPPPPPPQETDDQVKVNVSHPLANRTYSSNKKQQQQPLQQQTAPAPRILVERPRYSSDAPTAGQLYSHAHTHAVKAVTASDDDDEEQQRQPHGEENRKWYEEEIYMVDDAEEDDEDEDEEVISQPPRRRAATPPPSIVEAARGHHTRSSVQPYAHAAVHPAPLIPEMPSYPHHAMTDAVRAAPPQQPEHEDVSDAELARTEQWLLRRKAARAQRPQEEEEGRQGSVDPPDGMPRRSSKAAGRPHGGGGEPGETEENEEKSNEEEGVLSYIQKKRNEIQEEDYLNDFFSPSMDRPPPPSSSAIQKGPHEGEVLRNADHYYVEC